MKRNYLVELSAVSLVLAATAAYAVVPQEESSRWIEQRVAKRVVSRIEGRLQMTSAQREEVKSILKTDEPTMLALAAKGRQEREELAEMPSFEEGRVREVAQRYAATNTEILVERARLRMELRAVLNPAQRQQLETMRGRIGIHAEARLDTFLDAI